MSADGHTKGSVSREAICLLCSGTVRGYHDFKSVHIPAQIVHRIRCATAGELAEIGLTRLSSASEGGDGPFAITMAIVRLFDTKTKANTYADGVGLCFSLNVVEHKRETLQLKKHTRPTSQAQAW